MKTLQIFLGVLLLAAALYAFGSRCYREGAIQERTILEDYTQTLEVDRNWYKSQWLAADSKGRRLSCQIDDLKVELQRGSPASVEAALAEFENDRPTTQLPEAW